MKKITSIFILILFLGIIQTLAQTEENPKRAIILELHFKNLEKPETFELPLDLNEHHSKSGAAGGGAAYGCGECDKSDLPPSFYFNNLSGSVVRKGKANLFLSIDVNETCKIRQKFSVIHNKPTKLKLKCNVDLVTYYGFVSEKE